MKEYSRATTILAIVKLKSFCNTPGFRFRILLLRLRECAKCVYQIQRSLGAITLTVVAVRYY